MASEEPPGVLYDFLYKDAERIASYYAQIFSGRITSHEYTKSTREANEKTLKGSISIVAGDHKIIKETVESTKTSIDPHDLIATDILTYLRENNRVTTNIRQAPAGQIVRASGTLMLQDSTMLRIIGRNFQATVEIERKKSAKQRDPLLLQSYECLLQFLEQAELPSLFVLHTEDGLDITGCVQNSFLTSTATSCYYQHGYRGLSNVHLIGIKDDADIQNKEDGLASFPMLSMVQNVANAFSSILVSTQAFRVTPIAIFRVIL